MNPVQELALSLRLAKQAKWSREKMNLRQWPQMVYLTKQWVDENNFTDIPEVIQAEFNRMDKE